MLGFPVALLVVNGFEWYAHKVWLHEYPRKHRGSPFFSHITHHKKARLQGFEDDSYTRSMWQDQLMFNEKVALIGLSVAFTPTVVVAPFFTAGIYYGAWQYWSKHSRAHLDPAWAKAHPNLVRFGGRLLENYAKAKMAEDQGDGRKYYGTYWGVTPDGKIYDKNTDKMVDYHGQSNNGLITPANNAPLIEPPQEEQVADQQYAQPVEMPVVESPNTNAEDNPFQPIKPTVGRGLIEKSITRFA